MMNKKLILKVFVACISLLPVISFGQDNKEFAYNYQVDNKKHTIVIYSPDDNFQIVTVNRSNYELEYTGNIKISPNDKEITAISPNGYFKVSKVVFGNKRTVEISSDNSGKLTRKYYEGKTEKSFNNDGKEWLADVLPDIVKISGVAAESRVHNIYNKGGMSELLDEIDDIDDYSGAVRNLYFLITVDQLKLTSNDLEQLIPDIEMVASNSTKGTLLREILYKYNLSEENTVRLLRTAGTLDYNTERGSILRVLNPKFVESPMVVDAYFDVIEDMSINSEKGNVLKHLMQCRKLSDRTYFELFESLEDFSSERERGAVLLSAINYIPLTDRVVNEFMEAVDDLSSSYYVLKGELMNSLIERQTGANNSTNGNKAIILQLLNTALDYSSNSQKALTLRKVNNIFIEDYEVLKKYKECLSSVSSQIEQYNILLDLLETKKLGEKGYEMVLDATAELVSDDYQHAGGAVLRSALNNMPDNDELIYQFFSIVERMDQNCTIEELLRYINTNSTFKGNELVVLKTIEAVDQISVDIERSSVLLLVKPQIKNKEQKLAYSYLVKDFESDYLRRRTAF